LLKADLAILMEPSDAGVEAGCQGVLMADITVRGERAHTARAWRGVTAAHRAGAVLQRLADHAPERVVIDGLEYREGLNAVAVRAGVAGNVVPDECVITVNSRFAPSRSAEEPEKYVRDLFPEDAYEVDVTEVVAGALPGSTGRRSPHSRACWEPRPVRSWAGRTWPVSPPSARPPSTTAPAIRSSRTRRGSTSPSDSGGRARSG
jgi:acetylornithine deacetylase/succinyl-diaminopimelate desuccinylase-like protein